MTRFGDTASAVPVNPSAPTSDAAKSNAKRMRRLTTDKLLSPRFKAAQGGPANDRRAS
jgi:hypothetical protein